LEHDSLSSRSLWRLDTFLVPPGALEARAVTLEGSEHRHALGAARVAPGDEVRLIDGEGAEALALVESSTRTGATLSLLEKRTHRRDDGARLTIAQAVPKGRGMDEVVRRCAELGVEAVLPLSTSRTIVRLRDTSVPARLERWRSVARAATKQSRGVFVTSVLEPMSPSDLEPRVREADLALVAWEEERDLSLKDALRRGPARRLLAVVGPEGGLSVEEVSSLRGWGALPVSLGRRVLRSDWAAASLATVVSHELGGLLP